MTLNKHGWSGRLGTALSLATCPLVVLGLYTAKLETRTNLAVGHVVKVETHADGGTVPTVAFTAPNGVAYAFGGLERDDTPWRIGDVVGVRYDPQYPQDAHADDPVSRWWFPVALAVFAVVFACLGWLIRRRAAPPHPIFRCRPGERVRLSVQVIAEQGGSTSLRQLYVTDGRVVLGQVRVLRLIARLLLTVIVTIELLSFVPAMPSVAYAPIVIGVILIEAFRISRRAPIVTEHALTSITRLSLSEPKRWTRQGVVVAFAGAQDWTLRPAGKGGSTARPYAERIAAVSGHPIEDSPLLNNGTSQRVPSSVPPSTTRLDGSIIDAQRPADARPSHSGDGPDYRVPPSARLLIWLSYGFWLIGVNAVLLNSHALAHAAAQPDPSTGHTYMVNDHGHYSWVRAADIELFWHSMELSVFGIIACVLLLLICHRSQLDTIQQMVEQPRVYIWPMLATVLSCGAWWALG